MIQKKKTVESSAEITSCLVTDQERRGLQEKLNWSGEVLRLEKEPRTVQQSSLYDRPHILPLFYVILFDREEERMITQTGTWDRT